ncbi:MAG TPA: LamG domain-containing protein, partial [Lacipirellulaceae bacterium]|nr:LamG domain-containing protein [Lacipirellulaceae bacterium]
FGAPIDEGSVHQGAALEAPDAGDFEGDQPYTVAAWVKLPGNDSTGAIVARMDDQDGYRGWDLWVEGRRIGGHIIHQWPGNALKAVTRDRLPADRWVHVALVYDGSRKAAGLRVLVDGVSWPTDVTADALSGSIRTPVSLKLGQRHTGQPISGVQVEDVRIYKRALA